MAGNAVYDNAIMHLAIGEWTWNSGDTDIRVCLLGNTAPTKTHAHWQDLAGELADATGGYTQDTQQIGTLTTAHMVATVTHFESTATAFTGATYTAYYAATTHGAAKTTTNPLLSYHNLGGAQAVVAGTLTLTWATASGGVFTMTASAET